jgi:hypothetical protein
MLLEHCLRDELHSSGNSLAETCHVAQLAGKLAAAATAAASQSPSAADGGGGSSWSTAKAANQQMFSLLVSCLKISCCEDDKHLDNVQTLFDADISVASTISFVVKTSVQLLEPLGPSPLDRAAPASTRPIIPRCGLLSVTSPHSSSRLWVVLLGRCLVAAGMELQSHEQQTELLSLFDGSCKSTSEHPATMILGPSRAAVACLVRVLSCITTGAADDSQEQKQLQGIKLLLERAQLLLNILRSITQEAAAGEGGSKGLDCCGRFELVKGAKEVLLTSSAALPALGQYLVVLGAQVCAQLPVRSCCNYHLCSNTAKYSELELVSGKGSVCSGCTAARYCSSACQKAHWQTWHKPVCKQLSQQQQQQQQHVQQ